MILNTGARTDTVQYFTPWLLKRFEEGYVYTRNPLFPNKVTRYELSPDKIDVVMFCSKNYAPILPRLHEITDRYRTYFHYTITAYGKDIEPGVPSIDDSIATLIELEHIAGKNRIAWRYDPVLLTKDYAIGRHLETFAYMAEKLSPHIDRCIFSFVEMYKKLEANMPEIIPMTAADRDMIAKGMGGIAAKYGMRIQTCGTNGVFPLRHTSFGLRHAGNFRQSQQLRIQGYKTQRAARRMPLHREPRHRSIRHLPERLQILLCQQESAKSAGKF